MNSVNENKCVLFPEVKDGETFKVGEFELIKFPEVNGQTPVVMRDIVFRSRFGENNDLRESAVLERMKTEILPQIIATVGEENVCSFKMDLTTLDGLKPHGVMETQISLPNLDFYRANVGIFDRHKVNDWWWLATGESARPHCSPDWILCVSPSGDVDGGLCSGGRGVRPLLIFKSSIFESSEG